MAKIVKNSLGNFLVIFVIFSLVTGWIFSGWPRIWQKPAIPPEIQEANLSTALLLTNVLTFATLIIVNPPRAIFGSCGVLFLV
jgi:hypothetical protein